MAVSTNGSSGLGTAGLAIDLLKGSPADRTEVQKMLVKRQLPDTYWLTTGDVVCYQNINVISPSPIHQESKRLQFFGRTNHTEALDSHLKHRSAAVLALRLRLFPKSHTGCYEQDCKVGLLTDSNASSAPAFRIFCSRRVLVAAFRQACLVPFSHCYFWQYTASISLPGPTTTALYGAGLTDSNAKLSSGFCSIL